MNILPTKACLKERGIDFVLHCPLHGTGGNVSAPVPLLSYG